MIPFHSVLPEIAEREVRCIQLQPEPAAPPSSRLPGGEGALDPINTQSEHSVELLGLFQQHVLDEPYRRRLRQHYEWFREHNEPGLCRREFMESFTWIRLSNGIVLSWDMARRMGCLPPDARPEGPL